MNLKPTTHAELKDALNEGLVEFAFRKLNGDLRTAIGTRSLERVPLENHPTNQRAESSAVIRYYDVNKNWWRSVSTTQEVFIVE